MRPPGPPNIKHCCILVERLGFIISLDVRHVIVCARVRQSSPRVSMRWRRLMTTSLPTCLWYMFTLRGLQWQLAKEARQPLPWAGSRWLVNTPTNTWVHLFSGIRNECILQVSCWHGDRTFYSESWPSLVNVLAFEDHLQIHTSWQKVYFMKNTKSRQRRQSI